MPVCFNQVKVLNYFDNIFMGESYRISRIVSQLLNMCRKSAHIAYREHCFEKSELKSSAFPK